MEIIDKRHSTRRSRPNRRLRLRHQRCDLVKVLQDSLNRTQAVKQKALIYRDGTRQVTSTLVNSGGAQVLSARIVRSRLQIRRLRYISVL